MVMPSPFFLGTPRGEASPMIWLASCRGGRARTTVPSNNGLHQTGRGGAVASRPVVEARPAGEAGCWTCTGWFTK